MEKQKNSEIKGAVTNLKKFIGTKEVMAAPMDEATAVANGFARKNEDNHEWRPGYHVQYKNPDGSTYDSWSPKDVFEAAYQDASDFKARLKLEHAFVHNRFIKLKDALSIGYGAMANKIGERQAALLLVQFQGMGLYLEALSTRIDDLEGNL